MFTGIIEAKGKIHSLRPTSGGQVLSVDLGKLSDGTGLGDSIAINGVCLTVSRLAKTVADFDLSAETMAKSTAGKLKAPDAVNLERAMAADGRFGGHIVLGHVDGTAKIEAIDKRGDFWEIRFRADAQLLDEMVNKGSVAVDGISLTIASTDNSGFTIAVIPTTLKETTLGDARPGDVVNIETDILIKAVRKQLDKMLAGGTGLTAQKLKEYGF